MCPSLLSSLSCASCISWFLSQEVSLPAPCAFFPIARGQLTHGMVALSSHSQKVIELSSHRYERSGKGPDFILNLWGLSTVRRRRLSQVAGHRTKLRRCRYCRCDPGAPQCKPACGRRYRTRRTAWSILLLPRTLFGAPT